MDKANRFTVSQNETGPGISPLTSLVNGLFRGQNLWSYGACHVLRSKTPDLFMNTRDYHPSMPALPTSSLVALVEKSGAAGEVFVVDLADEACFVTAAPNEIETILRHNLTLLIDAKAALQSWHIKPQAELKIICLATIKKLIAKHHNEGLNLPEFSSNDDVVAWLKVAVPEAFDRIKKLEMSALAAVECAVIPAVIAMEQRGLPFNKERWQNTLSILDEDVAQLKRKLAELLPNDNGFLLFGQDPIDLNNAQAVKASLEKLLGVKLEGTSQSSLKDYDHEAVKLVLRYREHARMLSNYGEAFLDKIVDHRVRGHFTPIASASGRFACHDTNLLALPNDEQFQACITPRAPYRLTYFDYSGFELRILAALSGDETLIRIFHDEHDIHSMVAQEIFGVTVNKNENAHLRDQAKMLNFGLIYGMGDTALSRQLKISKGDAQALLHNYFKRFARVGEYLSSLESMAKTTGYVTTVLGRRAYFADYNDAGLIARLARNIPIQGTGADIVKLALCRVHKRLHDEKLDAHIINVVHDEIVIEAHEDVHDEAVLIVVDEMKLAFESLCQAVPAAISMSS